VSESLDHIKTHNQVKSKKRVSDHGEVFTAEREVNAMLDLVKQETERIESRFLEPADEKLYKKYALIDDEVSFIESMIRPMDLSQTMVMYE